MFPREEYEIKATALGPEATEKHSVSTISSAAVPAPHLPRAHALRGAQDVHASFHVLPGMQLTLKTQLHAASGSGSLPQLLRQLMMLLSWNMYFQSSPCHARVNSAVH